MSNTIRIRGTRQHNLKNINLVIGRDRIIVFTGVSGSDKSSLAYPLRFDDNAATSNLEGAYARQFIGQLDQPDVDAIEGYRIHYN